MFQEKNVQTYLSIGFGIIMFFAFGCSDNVKKPNSDNQVSETSDSKPTQSVSNSDVTYVEKIKQNLIGSWQLDSFATPATIDDKQSDLGKNVKLRGDNVICLYQNKYMKEGDVVEIGEYKNDGKYLTTHIDKFTIKKKPNGKNVSIEDYEVNGNAITTVLKWGKNNENETRTTQKIIIIDSVKLVLYYDGNGSQPTTTYYSRLK